jgi:hypothetical protein
MSVTQPWVLQMLMIPTSLSKSECPFPPLLSLSPHCSFFPRLLLPFLSNVIVCHWTWLGYRKIKLDTGALCNRGT